LQKKCLESSERGAHKLRPHAVFNKHSCSRTQCNLKHMLWRPCINKTSLSIVCGYVAERRPSWNVEAV